MRIQLWSYNFAPEPTGIAPISAVWVDAMTARGHRLEVVSAHPHYPSPHWGRRLLPYRERRGEVPVLRLPISVGRASAGQRIRQEASHVAALSLALPWLTTPDVLVAVSPSFPALACAMANARARRIPWVLWLQDLLPAGAASTGMLREGRLMAAARAFERRAYRSADRIVAISGGFRDELLRAGVPGAKIAAIANPATRPILDSPRDQGPVAPNVVLTMGNIGHTQNLAAVARAFEDSPELRRLDARFVLAGDGVAAGDVRAALRGERVTMLGLVDSARLERELAAATVALVSQRYDGLGFNLPSKIMNFMGRGIPIVALVPPGSGAASIVRESGAGWVCDADDHVAWARTIASALESSEERIDRGEAGRRYALEHFAPERHAERFERVLAGLGPARGV